MTLVVGAGLAGLAAANTLHNCGREVLVLDKEPYLGGVSRTLTYDGFRFDLGGHRFYTRNREVIDLVKRLLGDELLSVLRSSRIFLNGKFVNYPLTFFSSLSSLGLLTSANVLLTYTAERIKDIARRREVTNFEQWAISRFGRTLYRIYFRPYSEKIWGIPCTELSADFAAQRIRGLSFAKAIKSMISKSDTGPTTLLHRFYYPRRGFGCIPEALAAELPPEAIRTRAMVKRVEHAGSRVVAVHAEIDGRPERLTLANLISSIPMDQLVHALVPEPPEDVLRAADSIRYRDLVIVFLAIERESVTNTHWIYFPSEDNFLGRIHEPRNWSEAMSPSGRTSLVTEVFCFKEDAVWSESDESLAGRVAQQLETVGLIEAGQVTGSRVVRIEKAYPLYRVGYQVHVAKLLDYFRQFENLQIVGRSGQFLYISGDRYIEMGIKAARNVLGETHDLRSAANEEEYAEE